MRATAPRPLLGVVLLLFVSAAWGSAFPLMKDLSVRMPVADLLTERYGVAALVLFALRPRCLRGQGRKMWMRGIFLGVLFGVGQAAQAVALQSLPSPVSGFAVGCSVVMTPLLGLLLLGEQVSRRLWVAVALSAAAMAVFTLLQSFEDDEISVLALAATLMAAALYAMHTLVLSRMSGNSADGYPLTVIQLGTIAVMTGVLAAPGGLSLPMTVLDWVVLAHLAIVSCALGFLARTYGQAHVPAVPAAVVLSSQPLWVAALAAVVYGEAITWSVAVGGAMVVLAMLLAVVPGRSARQGGALAEEEHRPQPLPPERHAQLLRLRRRASEVLLALREESAGAEPGRPADVPHQRGSREASRSAGPYVPEQAPPPGSDGALGRGSVQGGAHHRVEEDAGTGVEEETDEGLGGAAGWTMAAVRERVELPQQPHLPSHDREEGGDASDRPERDAPEDGGGGPRWPGGGCGGGFGSGEDVRALAVGVDPLYPRGPLSWPGHLPSTDPYRRLDPYRF